MGKSRTGVDKLYYSPLGESFRAAWDGAVALAKNKAKASASSFVKPGTVPPSVDNRRKHPAAAAATGGLPGQMLNERGEWEDEASVWRRVEDARDSITMKLLRVRRMYLQEISDCPGKRAAFEILTELPVDWDRARRLEPQPDEPINRANQRKPDMILTAESGWSFGELGYGPDRKAEARRDLDAYLAEQGMEPVEWSE
jgi:hypothetical protein